MNRKINFLSAVMGITTLACIGLLSCKPFNSDSNNSPPKPEASTTIRYGISPYQDTALPIAAQEMGLYKKNGLDVEFISVAWEDIVPSLASAGKTFDVAIGSINVLLPKAENINIKGGGDIIFYCPFYVFKGTSLMMQKDSKMIPLTEFLKKYPNDRQRAIKETTEQLKAKRIGVPQGTLHEQMLYAALDIAGMDPKKDVDLRYIKLADGLPAFLAGDLDITGAGVTQRTEAARHGHKVFMDVESLGFAEIVGLVTTKEFAEAHPEELKKLVRIWFESMGVLFSDVDKYSQSVLQYLEKNASTKYTLEEFKKALEFQEFPRSIQAANDLFAEEDGKFYWKKTWDVVNDYLLKTKKVQNPIPYDAFWGKDSFRENL